MHNCLCHFRYLIKACICIGIILTVAKSSSGQCTFDPPFTATPNLDFSYFGGEGSIPNCAPINPSFYSLPQYNTKIIFDFYQTPEDYPGFRVWGLNTSDTVAVQVNDTDYALNASTASFTTYFVCGATMGPDEVAFANNYLVGTQVPMQENLAYSDIILNVPQVSTVTLTCNTGTGWGFAGVLTGCHSLPVTLLSFNVSQQNNKVLLNWQTSSEQNTGRFEIQYSSDGSQWQTIGDKAAAGYSNILRSYSFQQDLPENGVSYYRLKEIDLNGKVTYSAIKTITVNKQPVSVWPNPFKDRVYITTGNSSVIKSVTLLNAEGKQLQHYNSFANGASINTNNYASGLYIVLIINNKDNASLIKIVKD
jgi:hypothetical protein